MNKVNILNIAAYKFINLIELEILRKQLLLQCEKLQLKGTILLANEGINLILAGLITNIEAFIIYLQQDARFADLAFKKSLSVKLPFHRLRVRVKKEIVTLKKADINPMQLKGNYLSPHELKAWLDEKKDFILLDTRNAYEAEIGTFKNARTLPITYFSEFPQAIEQANIPNDKPLVMFCTGGIRCEKASAVMLKVGYKNVYQLQGGILKYFEQCGDLHYKGNCFVFDERTAITPRFEETGLTQCPRCSHFLNTEEQNHPEFIAWKRCQYCPVKAKLTSEHSLQQHN